MPILWLQAVAVRDGRVAYVAGLRRALRRRGRTRPTTSTVTTDTKYRIASISKPVIAIGMMQQVEAGGHRPGRRRQPLPGLPLPQPELPHEKITARMLLSHTFVGAGRDYYRLPGHGRAAGIRPPAGSTSREAPAGPAPIVGTDSSAGRYFCYENLNFGVLATILEAVTHQRFDRYMREHVLQPLGMRRAAGTCRDSRRSRLGQGGHALPPDGRPGHVGPERPVVPAGR